MISDVRTYLKAQLIATNSDFREWRDGFNRDNIPKSVFNKSFFISYSNSSNNLTSGQMVDDNISATVELFFKGFRDPQEAIDVAMDLAHLFKLRASDPCNFTSGIKHVVGNSITPEPVVSNDNSIIITLDFSLRMIFSTN